MSLNRYEQLLHDYIEGSPEERSYWWSRVRDIERENGRREAAALELNAALWDYFEERSRHERALSDGISPGSGKVSLLNLSEYLLRMWGTGGAKPKARQSRR